MKNTFARSGIVAICSAAASLLIVSIAIPALGGTVDRIAVLMSLLCPLALAWPAAAYSIAQGNRLRAAHRELARAHAALAAAHRRLAETAKLDEMTGMLNRTNFFSVLDGSRRKDDRGTLLIIDADNFKRINDSFGHVSGDEALLQIAASISRGVRRGDVLGRIGGEEFAAFLVGANREEARAIAERVRYEVETIRFTPVQDHIVPLTVSIGGAHCAPDAAVPEIMRAADRHLYAAKRNGRNQTIMEPVQAAA